MKLQAKVLGKILKMIAKTACVWIVLVLVVKEILKGC